MADAFISYPEYFNVRGEERVYELHEAHGKYQERLLKHQEPAIEAQEGRRPAELPPVDGPVALSFPRGVCGQLVVRVTVLSRRCPRCVSARRWGWR